MSDGREGSACRRREALDTKWPIDIAMQSLGGADGLDVHWLGLKGALHEADAVVLPKGIDHLHFILRVDGIFGTFGGDGVDRVRVSRARRFVQVDICVPTARWMNRSHGEIADFICSELSRSVEKIVASVRRVDRAFDGAGLAVALNKAGSAYRAEIVKVK